MKCDETSRLLDAYMDGELDLANSLAVEDHMKGCAACRAQVEARTAFSKLVQEKLPRLQAPPFLATRIRAKLKEQEPVKRTDWWMLLGYFGFPALVLALVLVFILKPPKITDLAQEAINDHVRSLMVNHLMDVASTDQHTVKPWFAGKIDYSPPVIDFATDGYPLIGGRLDVLDQRTVAAVIYQRRKHYINLFIWPADQSTLPDTIYEKDGYRVLQWNQSGMNYLAVSELGEQELKDFVKMMKEHLPPPKE